jgi:hypothetical protein
MHISKLTSLLFGFAVGIAIAAIAIGFALVGIAVVDGLRTVSESSLLQHPLFVSGSELVSSGIVLGLLALATRKLVRR